MLRLKNNPIFPPPFYSNDRLIESKKIQREEKKKKTKQNSDELNDDDTSYRTCYMLVASGFEPWTSRKPVEARREASSLTIPLLLLSQKKISLKKKSS